MKPRPRIELMKVPTRPITGFKSATNERTITILAARPVVCPLKDSAELSQEGKQDA
jgi:hypothetical protein